MDHRATRRRPSLPYPDERRKRKPLYILGGHLTSYSEDGEIIAGPGTYLNIPACIEVLFDSLAVMEEQEGGFDDVIAALNRLGAGYGVTYLAD